MYVDISDSDMKKLEYMNRLAEYMYNNTKNETLLSRSKSDLLQVIIFEMQETLDFMKQKNGYR